MPKWHFSSRSHGELREHPELESLDIMLWEQHSDTSYSLHFPQMSQLRDERTSRWVGVRFWVERAWEGAVDIAKRARVCRVKTRSKLQASRCTLHASRHPSRAPPHSPSKAISWQVHSEQKTCVIQLDSNYTILHSECTRKGSLSVS